LIIDFLFFADVMYYENLPIYKKAVELVVLLETIVLHFSRFHRYEIDADMRRMSRDLATRVIAASFAVDKVMAEGLRPYGQGFRESMVQGACNIKSAGFCFYSSISITEKYNGGSDEKNCIDTMDGFGPDCNGLVRCL
jgi:hypothetical protein